MISYRELKKRKTDQSFESEDYVWITYWRKLQVTKEIYLGKIIKAKQTGEYEVCCFYENSEIKYPSIPEDGFVKATDEEVFMWKLESMAK